jgi:hypothetical protein
MYQVFARPIGQMHGVAGEVRRLGNAPVLVVAAGTSMRVAGPEITSTWRWKVQRLPAGIFRCQTRTLSVSDTSILPTRGLEAFSSSSCLRPSGHWSKELAGAMVTYFAMQNLFCVD